MTMAWIHQFASKLEGENDVMARPTLRIEKVDDTAVRPRQSGPPDPHDQWVPFGPAGVANGQAAGRPRITGRVRTFAVDPTGARIYVGTARGGVWYSEDAGHTWLAIDAYAAVDKLNGSLGEANALSIGSLAVEWGASAADDTVYVGTGEAAQRTNSLPMHARGVGVRLAKGPAQFVKDHGLPTDPWRVESAEQNGVTLFRGKAITRLRIDPTRPGVVWAATSLDLFVRIPQLGGSHPWESPLVNSITTGHFADVILTKSTPPRVLAVTTSGELWMAPHPYDPANPPKDVNNKIIPWTPIKLDVPKKFKFVNAALALDATDPIVYVVANGSRLWRVDCATAKAEPISGLPGDIFGKQADYDMAIAAHPSNPGEIIVGGQVHDHNAALFKGTVKKSATTWKLTSDVTSGWVGRGVHADVHEIGWQTTSDATAPVQLWVACDGGLFHSAANGAASTFTSQGNGIGALECNYLANHPTSPGVLLTGSQDNGAFRSFHQEMFRVGALGDAGGVAFDPNDPRRAIAQSSEASWAVSADGGLTFTDSELYDLPDLATSEFWQHVESGRKSENKAASFYCEAAVIADGSTTQLAIGTDRVWFSTSFGRKPSAGKPAWVTLPSMKNAHSGGGFINRTRDVLDGGILALRWADKDRLVVLARSVYLLDRSGTTWAAKPTRLPQKFPYQDDNGVEQFSTNPSVSAMTIHRHVRTDASITTDLYVVASGSRDGKLKVQPHIWWFDGAKQKWFNARFTVDTPLYAVCCDPTDPTVVYLGSDVGVWKGRATFPADGSAPSWAWTQFTNGLPEVTVDDLTIVDVSIGNDKRRLLRAALRGRGIWELDLTGAIVKPELFVRAHEFDTRRWPLPSGDIAHPFANPNPNPPAKVGAATPARFPATARLDASPDIHIRRSPHNAVPPPVLSWPVTSSPPVLVTEHVAWLAQTVLRAQSVNLALPAALRATLREIVPDGVGGTATVQALQAVAKSLGAPALAKLDRVVVAALLALPPIATAPNRVLFDNAEPSDPDQPDALDVAWYLHDEPDFGAGPASCATGDGTVLVHVVLHARHWKALPPAETWVTLLRTPLTGAPNLATIPKLPVGWATSLFSDGHDRSSTPAPAGAWLGADWSYVDKIRTFRSPSRGVDPNNPQVITFDVELFSPTTATGWYVVAIVHTDTDPLLPTDGTNLSERDVETLVRTNRHVALRTVRRG